MRVIYFLVALQLAVRIISAELAYDPLSTGVDHPSDAFISHRKLRYGWLDKFQPPPPSAGPTYVIAPKGELTIVLHRGQQGAL